MIIHNEVMKTFSVYIFSNKSLLMYTFSTRKHITLNIAPLYPDIAMTLVSESQEEKFKRSDNRYVSIQFNATSIKLGPIIQPVLGSGKCPRLCTFP